MCVVHNFSFLCVQLARSLMSNIVFYLAVLFLSIFLKIRYVCNELDTFAHFASAVLFCAQFLAF